MRWRDVRFEKPTEADVDEFGGILQLLDTGSICRWNWKSTLGAIAWMPISELPAFTPIPDPPEGWRFVEKGEAFDKRAMFWHEHTKSFIEATITYYMAGNTYIVPIDPPAPPEPTYRPFANAAEFEPHRDKWWRYKGDVCDMRRPPISFNNLGHGNETWVESLGRKEFAGGTPFGVKVEP
jgi:hypothetical protein